MRVLVFASRGQMALDLLLAMIVLLVALNAFNPILARFQDTQAQVSLTQQLRSDAALSALFISDSVNHFRTVTRYPRSNTFVEGSGLPAAWNNYAHFVGSVAPSSIRALNTAQGFNCTSAFSWTPPAPSFTLTLSRTDAGTDEDAVGSSFVTYDPDYPTSMVHFQGCYSPLVIRSGS